MEKFVYKEDGWNIIISKSVEFILLCLDVKFMSSWLGVPAHR